MNKLFLSFSFRDRDRTLVAHIERLLASHDIVVVTGRRTGGEPLTPAIQQLIDECDGLIALLTQRDELASGGYTTHPWVRDELNYARNRYKPTIALLENDVRDGGSFGENEWLALDHAAPLEAMLALSETIGLWKRRAGRRLKIQLLPETVAQQAALAMGDLVCHYRFVDTAKGEFYAWQEARQIPEQGGTFIYVTGIQEDFLIQLRIEYGDTHWQSRAMPTQSLPIELIQIGGD